MRHFPRIAAVVLLAAAVYLAVRLAYLFWSDPELADPPIGAICMAVPVVILLIGAGAAWGAGKPRWGSSRDEGSHH